MDDRLVHDVESVKLVGDLFLRVRDIAGEPIRTGDGFRIVVTEGGDGAVVGTQLAQQTECFEVANTGPFQMVRGADLVEIAPDVGPEHVAGKISGAAEAELSEVQAGDVRIDDTHERVGPDIVLYAGRERAAT